MMYPAPANSEVDTVVKKVGVATLHKNALSQEKGRTCYDLGTFSFKNSAKSLKTQNMSVEKKGGRKEGSW